MEKVKLGDVSKLINGDRGKNYPSQADITEEGEIPFVNAGHLNGREIDFSEMNYISQDKYDNLRSGKFQEGDILYCLRGSLGKKAIVSNDVNGAIASSLVIIRPDKEKVDGEYLMFALDSPEIKEQLVKANNGSSQPNLSASSVREYQVELPNISVQKEVVEKLIKVRNIIDCRRKELQLLDSLIKARFVEMFGNPVINEKRWRQKSLGEITTKIGSGATPKGGKGAYQEEGITLIRSMNVHNGLFEYKELAHISDEQATKLDNVVIEENDVLLNITGASVARSCVVPSKILPARVNQHVCIIRCKKCINPEFLNKLLIDDNYQDLLWSIAGAGATREAITKQQVENLQIIMPPIELQIEFMRFCNQVNKSKFAVQKTLEQTQTLFDSLMQKYFG